MVFYGVLCALKPPKDLIFLNWTELFDQKTFSNFKHWSKLPLKLRVLMATSDPVEPWRRLWHVSLNHFTRGSCQGLRLWLSKATAVGTLRDWTCRELPRLLVFSRTTRSSRNPETQLADFGFNVRIPAHFCEMGGSKTNEWLDEFINIHQFRSQLLGYHLGTLFFPQDSGTRNGFVWK